MNKRLLTVSYVLTLIFGTIWFLTIIGIPVAAFIFIAGGKIRLVRDGYLDQKHLFGWSIYLIIVGFVVTGVLPLIVSKSQAIIPVLTMEDRFRETLEHKKPLMTFEHVDKIYPNGFQALKDINLNIYAGEFVAIIGLSGAGKSTLLRTVNKMHPISNGKLLVGNIDVGRLEGYELRIFRRNIGMIFQSFNLVKRMSVYKNVLAGRVAFHSSWATFFGFFPRKDKLIALEALDKMGILEKAWVRADQLSGGQQQRVALARALAQDPKLILADEPVASLDPVTTISVMDDFKRINKELGITILTNMHHVDLALKYATRVIGIKSGEIVFDGPVSKVDAVVLESIYGRPLTDDDVLEEKIV